MPRQIERELHARRKFRKALVDAELEIERAVLVPQHDRRRRPAYRRPAASRSRIGRSRRARGVGAADEGGIALVLDQRGAALAFPAAGLERQEYFERGATSSRVRATSKRTAPCSARRWRWRRSSFSFLAPAPRAATRRRRAWHRDRRADWIAARADAGRRGRERIGDGFHRRAIERDVAQDQRVGAGFPCLEHQARRGVIGPVAIEQRRAERAVGMGAHQRGQGNVVGARHRDDRHQADQPRRVVLYGIAWRDQRRRAGAAAGDAFTASSQSGR